MAADVGHDMDAAVAVARDDQRHAIAVVRDRRIVVRQQRRGREQQRQLVEDARCSRSKRSGSM